MNVKIFENETSDGQYPANGKSLTFKQGLLNIAGTFDGATVKLQMKAPDGDFQDVRDISGIVVTWTAPVSDVNVPYIPSGYLLRGDISGAGGSTDLTMGITN